MSPSARHGFSLVDVATSIAVIMLLTAMVVPSLRRMSQSQTTARAARVAANDLERGFSLAARLRQPVVFRCDCDARVLEVRLAGSDSVLYARRFDDASGFALGTMTMTDSVTVSAAGVGSRELTLDLASGPAAKRVVLSTAGLARVEFP